MNILAVDDDESTGLAYGQTLTGRNHRVTDISDEALRLLESDNWPGIVRELENTIERTLVMAEGLVLEPHNLFFYDRVKSTPATEALTRG